MTTPSPLDALRRTALLVAAALVFALSFNWFFAQSYIAFGGVTGIAQTVNALIPTLPIGMLVIAFNLPLFLLGWRLLGFPSVAGSLLAMTLSSVFIDLTAPLVTFPPMEPLLACLFGGVGTGLALGVIFMQGATTGGTDLAARLLKLRLGWLPMGQVIMALDLVVIASYSFVFRSIEGALYGVVALYVSVKAIDLVLYGVDTARVAYIISAQHEAITAAILEDLGRGVTLLSGKGAWSGEDKQVVFVAFKQRQIVEIRRVVKEIDPTAFLIVCPAHEVLGEGFRSHTDEHL